MKNNYRVSLSAYSRPVEEILLWSQFLADECCLKNTFILTQHWKFRKLLAIGSDALLYSSGSHSNFEIGECYTLTHIKDSKESLRFAMWGCRGLIMVMQTYQIKNSSNKPWDINTKSLSLSRGSIFGKGYIIHQEVNIKECIKLLFSNKELVRLYPSKFILSFFGDGANLVFKSLSKKSNIRCLVSLNWRSAEFTNMKRIFRVSTIKLCLNLFFHQRATKFFSYKAENFREEVLSLWLDRLSQKPFCYIGLPGARLVEDIVSGLQNNVTTVHISHGRITSNKFLKYTDYVFSRVQDNFNCGNIKIFNEKTDFIFGSGSVVWVHGYKKGRRYSLSNFFKDFKVLKKITKENPRKNVILFIHPTAHIFSISMKIFCIFSKKIQKKSLKSFQIIQTEKIYCSSPTFLEYHNQKTVCNRGNAICIPLINLRENSNEG